MSRNIISLLLIIVAAGAWSGPRAEVSRVSEYQLHKTERLLREQLSCLGCHRFGDEGGRLAPDLLGVRERLSRVTVRRIISDPQKTVPGTMMPRLPMTEARQEQLIAYLFQHQRKPATSQAIQRPATVAAATRGADALFQRYCAGCHGSGGRGDGFNAVTMSPGPADLTDPHRMARRPDDTLYDIIAAGGRAFDLSPRMPAWGQTLEAEEIRALVTYIRDLCSCVGPAWSRDGG